MKAVNKAFKFFGYAFVHLSTAIGVYSVALLLASPVCCLALAIFDLFNLGFTFTYHFLYIWLLSGLLIFIPLYIYVEIKAHKKI